MSALIARQQPSLAERLADLAVQALVDEADLSPKPGLVDRRGNGAHDDLHLGLMHASANALWPTFKAMADAALVIGEVGQPLRETLGQLGRDGEAEMLRVTGGVNTHRGAIWALGLLSAAAALESAARSARPIAASAAALARLAIRPRRPTPTAMVHGSAAPTACSVPVNRRSTAFPRSSNRACRSCTPAAAPVPASRTPGSMRCWRS
ncbi:2-(5''-triphosphoribosyl)-3'-dephosphocoenzyme-A synthase [Stutzerimonas stutzeri]